MWIPIDVLRPLETIYCILNVKVVDVEFHINPRFPSPHLLSISKKNQSGNALNLVLVLHIRLRLYVHSVELCTIQTTQILVAVLCIESSIELNYALAFGLVGE